MPARARGTPRHVPELPPLPTCTEELAGWSIETAKAIRLAIHKGLDTSELNRFVNEVWQALAGVTILFLPAKIAKAYCYHSLEYILIEARGELVYHVLELLERLHLPDALPSENAKTANTKKKKSTDRGDGRTKLIAALVKHHQYADNCCLNTAPIGNNELATAAGVSTSTASEFFSDKFEGHSKYKAVCRQRDRLLSALMLLNDDYSPHHLYGSRPRVEGRQDEDDE